MNNHNSQYQTIYTYAHIYIYQYYLILSIAHFNTL